MPFFKAPLGVLERCCGPKNEYCQKSIRNSIPNIVHDPKMKSLPESTTLASIYDIKFSQMEKEKEDSKERNNSIYSAHYCL